MLVCAVLPPAAGAAAAVGTTTPGTEAATRSPGKAQDFSVTSNASGTVNRLSVYLDGSNTASKVSLGLYRKDTRLASCLIGTPVAGSWNRCTFPDVSVKDGSTYWTAVLQPEGSSGTIRFRRSFSGRASHGSARSTLTALPSSWTTGETWSGQTASIYADQASAPAPPPSVPPVPPVPPLPPSPRDTAASADFTFTPSAPKAGQQVTFEARGGGDAPLSYKWEDDGSDGAGGTQWSLGTGDPMTFTFNGAGTKHVRLTVTDADGDTATALHDVAVTAAQSSPPPPAPAPADSDSDGVPDSQDRCPNQTGPASNNGCPNSPSPPPSSPPPSSPPPSSSGSCPAWPSFPTSGATASGCTGFRHTGVTLTAYTGPSSITTAGTVIDGKDITTCLTINAPNVTITRSYVHCGNGIVVNSKGFLIEDSELNGNGATGCDWLLGSNQSTSSLVARRIYAHDCADGFRVNGDFTLEDSYLGGLRNNAGDHNDGMQGYGPGGNVHITHDYLDSRTQNGSGMNGVVFFADGWKGNVYLTQNMLVGGSISLRLHDSGHYWVTSNRILAGSYTNGPVNTEFGAIEQWTDNKLCNASGADGADLKP
jgi:hypothetical protein